jgi:hypothetical protein
MVAEVNAEAWLEDVEVLISLEILDLGILLVEFFRNGRKELCLQGRHQGENLALFQHIGRVLKVESLGKPGPSRWQLATGNALL